VRPARAWVSPREAPESPSGSAATTPCPRRSPARTRCVAPPSTAPATPPAYAALPVPGNGCRASWSSPISRLPVDLRGTAWLPLTHVWSKRWNAPIYFFRCPRCYRRVRRLLRLNEEDRWACRQCHRAKYASQLQSVRRRGIAHLAILDRLVLQLQRPGRRTRTMAQLSRKVERTGAAFEADWPPRSLFRNTDHKPASRGRDRPCRQRWASPSTDHRHPAHHPSPPRHETRCRPAA
jgi:hypothetical protein